MTPAGASVDGVALSLSPTERSVLYELATADGELVTRATLLDRCWSRSIAPGARAVDVVISRLRSKLGASKEFLIPNERELGYRLVHAKTRVLVVEDDELLYSTYRLALAELDVDVDFAESVEACRALASKHVYRACFVDLQLSGGSGVDAIALIRARTPRAAIMIVSGREDRAALELSAVHGVAYAIKPVCAEVLRRFVERASA